MQENLTTKDLRDYAEARVQADRAERLAEQGPCAWMQNIDAALKEPLFQALRGMMGTENMGQDMALLQTIRHYRAKSPQETGQAPAAWVGLAENGNIRIWTQASAEAVAISQREGLDMKPLYAAPLPAAKALTDREALMLAAQAGIKMKTGANALKLIRATEAHYGIKAPTQTAQA